MSHGWWLLEETSIYFGCTHNDAFAKSQEDVKPLGKSATTASSVQNLTYAMRSWAQHSNCISLAMKVAFLEVANFMIPKCFVWSTVNPSPNCILCNISQFYIVPLFALYWTRITIVYLQHYKTLSQRICKALGIHNNMLQEKANRVIHAKVQHETSMTKFKLEV